MVALIVHNQMLAMLSTASQLMFAPQTDRDTVEPQVQDAARVRRPQRRLVRVATTPDEART